MQTSYYTPEYLLQGLQFSSTYILAEIYDKGTNYNDTIMSAFRHWTSWNQYQNKVAYTVLIRFLCNLWTHIIY